MKYIITVDTQSRNKPTENRKEIVIETQELRKKGNVHDDLIIENNQAKVIRRIGKTQYDVTYVLDKEVVEELGEVKIPLFEGDNYIYIKDEYNNNLCAEYIIKNDFTDRYVTNMQLSSAIEQTAENISLTVDKKLEGYSDTEEMQSAIEVKAEEITSSVSSEYATKGELRTAKSEIKQTTDSIISEVSQKVDDGEFGTKIQQDAESVQIAWNKISEFIQFINTELQVKDGNKKLLMKLNKNGQEFWESEKYIGRIGTNKFTNALKNVIEFELFEDGYMMAWCASDGKDLLIKLAYVRENVNEWNEGLHLGASLYTEGSPIFLNGDVRSRSWELGAGFSMTDCFYLTDLSNNTIASFSPGYGNEFFANVNMHGYEIINCNNFASDGRLKKSIYDSQISAIDRVKQIRHREFIWKEKEQKEEVGYIAQELEAIDENYIRHNFEKDREGNIIGDRYEVRVLPLLSTATKAIQEQQVIIEEQQEMINKQQQFIEIMKNKLELQEEYDKIFAKEVKQMQRKVRVETIYEGEIPDREVVQLKEKQSKRKIIKHLENGEIEIINKEE